MHTLIQPIELAPRTSLPGTADQFRAPHCDLAEQSDGVEATVYLPGTEARSVELLVSGRHLVLTARKERPVRANWLALNLERLQRDYRLRLYLGRKFDLRSLHAEFFEGVLKLRVPRVIAGGTGELTVAVA